MLFGGKSNVFAKDETFSANTETNELKEYFGDAEVHDTIYFTVQDDKGITSYAHDSGVKPSVAVKDASFIVSKIEYNDGIVRTLSTPTVLKYGQHPLRMTNTIDISAFVSVDHDLYTITVPMTMLVLSPHTVTRR